MNKEKKITTSRIVSGFILIETIVAISIVMLALPAALTVVSKSLILASYSKEQIVATYLAQEGIEIIRNKRDGNILKVLTGSLNSSQWRDGFWTGDCLGTPCRVDYGIGPAGPLIQKCIGGGCSLLLNKNTADGSYSHDSGGTMVPTIFSRYIQTEAVFGNPDEIRVVSVVSYSTRGINKVVTFQENLTKWIQ